MTQSAEIAARMRTLLSEADSGAMGWKARLEAAMDLVAQAWDEGFDSGYDVGYSDVMDPDADGMRRHNPYPYRPIPPGEDRP